MQATARHEVADDTARWSLVYNLYVLSAALRKSFRRGELSACTSAPDSAAERALVGPPLPRRLCIHMHMGLGTAFYTTPGLQAGNTRRQGPLGVAAEDLDGRDKRDDLVTFNNDGTVISVLLSSYSGNGSFAYSIGFSCSVSVQHPCPKYPNNKWKDSPRTANASVKAVVGGALVKYGVEGLLNAAVITAGQALALEFMIQTSVFEIVLNLSRVLPL